ncbi:hypothetical protein SAMN05443637_101216 [Pseudonocardia thermophila]|uniref:Prenyltransferase and squalene oxidase repeat-containing protein n=1 Tax=Pseudonocardia thermophila TaxID=1848 RepID=A0A1M6NF82_PSETH|nr:hypothetical protein [Pseudonocardia thermophila]SHJ94246.1 hypothetical protein SAMN05443637_101216 [Pseudonocardia thermophila]
MDQRTPSPLLDRIDLGAAADFLATHARVLDRRRFELLIGEGSPDALAAALAAYRNPDGGYGWGLEPDLRSTSSQPGPALHAFEVLAELAAAGAPVPEAVGLCDWLASVTAPEGGLRFAEPFTDRAGCAPFWVEPAPGPSLQITAIAVATAYDVARHEPAVAAHPWLATATRFCLDVAAALTPDAHAIELAFTLRFLDAVHDVEARARELMARLGSFLPPDGILPVQGGAEGESMRPLDVAPHPGRPVRELFSPDAVAAELDRLAGLQQADGGWPVEWQTYSPAAELEWRGYLTVRALSVLRANG